MVAIGTAFVGLAAWAAIRWRRHRSAFHKNRWFLRAIVVSGPAAVVAMETGWITTEVGRQPWVVNGLLRTEDAVTDANYIWVTFIGLAIVYLALTLAGTAVIRSMTRRWVQR